MNKSYVIQWKSKINGRAGRGTKFFGRGEAEQLADELNQDYPQIEHEAVAASSARFGHEEPAALSEARRA